MSIICSRGTSLREEQIPDPWAHCSHSIHLSLNFFSMYTGHRESSGGSLVGGELIPFQQAGCNEGNRPNLRENFGCPIRRNHPILSLSVLSNHTVDSKGISVALSAETTLCLPQVLWDINSGLLKKSLWNLLCG